MSSSGYRLAEIFVIRPTGVPFEVLEALSTPAVATAARALLVHKAELSTVVQRAAEAIDRSALAFGQQQRLRRKLFKRSLAIQAMPEVPELAEYLRVHAATSSAEAELTEVLARDYEASRTRMYELAARHLPDIAVIQLTGDGLVRMLANRTRKDDRSLAIWLQRVCSKNDTISRFGPSAWGTIDPDEPGIRIAPRPDVLHRTVWIERWVVRDVIGAINAVPEARAEIAPRLHPCWELDGERAWRQDTGQEIALAPGDRALLARCDGRTPAYQLDASDQLSRLADAGLVCWELETMYTDDAPITTLASDIASWRETPLRGRWTAVVEELSELAATFLREIEPAQRQRVIDRVDALLTELGIAKHLRTGRLYEAANPLVENCSREGDFAIGRGISDELVRDATPWFDLFRDSSAFAAHHVYTRLRELFVQAPRHGGRLSLASYLAFCKAQDVDLAGAGFAKLGEEAFAEIKTGFARQFSGRADAPAWELTTEDCAFLRGKPGVPRADLAYASADLQVAAASCAAVARGDFEWVVAELHHDLALLGQSLVWSCPDRERLAAASRAAHLHQPILYFDTRGSTLAPVHVSNEFALGALNANVVTQHRTKPHWKTFSPANVDIVLDEAKQDLRARCVITGTDLGTLFPLARYFFGMHPFFPLQLDPHTPRLRRGRTILQRRSWMVTLDDMGGPFGDELSPALVLAIEKLRATRDVPRWVFMRVRSDVLSGADPLGRLKDVKPIGIDLESYVFMEIFARRLHKYGAIELTEMVPSPEQLVWQEADGRRCFELRTLLVPATP